MCSGFLDDLLLQLQVQAVIGGDVGAQTQTVLCAYLDNRDEDEQVQQLIAASEASMQRRPAAGLSDAADSLQYGSRLHASSVLGTASTTPVPGTYRIDM